MTFMPMPQQGLWGGLLGGAGSNQIMQAMNSPLFNVGLGLLSQPNVGQGVASGLQGYRFAQQNALNQQLRQAQIDQIEAQKEQQQRRNDALYGSPSGRWTNPDTGEVTGSEGLVNQLPPEARGLAQAFPEQFGQAMARRAFPDPQKPTTLQQNYEQAVSQGYQGSLLDYQIALKKAGQSQTNVNVHTGDQMSPLWDVTQPNLVKQGEAVQGGRDLLPRYETILSGLKSGQQTGRVLDVTRPIRQIADELGVAVDPNLPQEEQLSAAMQYLVPRMRVAGSGSTSDREMKAFAQAAPNFYNTPGGNIIIAATAIQQQGHLEREFELKQAYAMQNNGSLVGFSEFAAQQLGPMFPEPKTKEEMDRLPEDTVFIAPNGEFRVKGSKGVRP